MHVSIIVSDVLLGVMASTRSPFRGRNTLYIQEKYSIDQTETRLSIYHTIPNTSAYPMSMRTVMML